MIGRCEKLLLLTLAATTGCMPRVDHGNRPPVARVNGTVLYRGQPVGDAHVTFIPNNGSAAAFGQTDASGRFCLTTFNAGDGAVIGPHAVRIVKHEIIGAPPSDNPVDYQRYENQPPAKMRSLLPKNYADPKRSGLKAEVIDSESNDFTFELNADGRSQRQGSARQLVGSRSSAP